MIIQMLKSTKEYVLECNLGVNNLKVLGNLRFLVTINPA
jgi:hypothetical protein